MYINAKSKAILELGSHVRYYDFNKDVIDYCAKDFLDYYHLNSFDARKSTKKLAKWITRGEAHNNDIQ